MSVVLVLCALAAGDASVLDGLERLDRELVTAERRLQDLEAERLSLRVEQASLTAERAAADVREHEAQGDFTRRLRSLSRMPAGARAALLGGVHSLAELLETERVLRWVATHDRKLHERWLAESRHADELRRGLVEREQRLASAEQEARAERDRQAAIRAERLALLTSVVRDRPTAERAAGELRLAHSSLATLLRRLSPAAPLTGSFAQNRGRLPWPVAGKLGAGFGDVKDPRFGTTAPHPGLDLLAPVGTPVQAVAAGTVVFAGWLKGYGQLVILDHGGDYHTLSAHLAELRVRPDQPVAAGAILGTVGETGSFGGAGLYFELRRAGAPEDPTPWLRR